jgi:hypothetical protein
MYLGRRRYGTYSAQPHLVYLEGVRSPECRPHIMGAAYVVKDNYKTGFRQLLVFIGLNPAQFYIQKLPVMHKFSKSYQHKGK